MNRTVTLSILAILICVSFPYQAHAQDGKGGIKGIVTDSLTGERLSLANIYILDQGSGAATDVNGFYFIGNIKAQTVQIRASLLGYRTVVEEVEIKAGQIIDQNFELAPTAIEMEAIEKTAERRLRYDTEISTMPIGSREIEIVPATVESDLFRTISILPGVVATSDVNSQFYVRGGGGDQNLIILDGMTVYNPFHALGIFSIFDADAVKEAEILKGGFPAEWGNRLSSVINIRTKEGNRKRFSGKINMSQVSGKVMMEGPTPWDGSWMFAGRKSFFDEVLQEFVRQETPFDFHDFMGRVNVSTGESGRLSLHVLNTADKISPLNRFEPEYTWANSAYGMTWFQVLESKYLIETTFSFSNFKGELFPRENPDLTPRTSEISDVYFNGSVTYFQDNGDQYGAGFMFRLPGYKYSFVNSANFFIEEDTKNSETGMWFKYKFKQWDPFSIEIGLRSDLFALVSAHSSDAFEPRFGFTWDITESYAFKAAYSRVHQRVVTITNEDDLVSLFQTWIPVPEDDPSQQADHYIVGIDGDIPFIPGMNFDIQGYYKDMKNLLEFNREKVDANDPDFIQATGESYGMEVFLEQRATQYYGWVAYTLGHTIREAGALTYRPRYDRRHSVNFVFGYKPAPDWDFNLRWEFGSGLPFSQIVGFYDRLLFNGIFSGAGYSTEEGEPYTILGPKNAGRLPSYHRLDVSASKSFNLDPITLSVEASIINLYDRANMFYFDQSTGERIDMLPFLPTVTLKAEF
ncbi:MAG: hypothetical protein CL946_09885 [Ectothiorhodospiraceae bacterium]|nr:hypothetical protein [Ectothiorhodospiraceae bacterium]